MKKVLILFAHPVYQTSVVNKSLLSSLSGNKYVTIHDLYEVYPDFMIDVAYEQALLEAHDVVIFQHPMYWYSCPALLKEWIDLVLEHGFAHGAEANVLKHKIFMSSITSGGDQSNYRGEQSVRDLLKPFELTAKLCKMKYLPPFITYSGLKIKAGNFDKNLTTNYLEQQVIKFKTLMDDLVNDRIDPLDCEKYSTMNERCDLSACHND